MQWLTEETGWLFPEDDAALIPDSPEKLPALGAGLAGAAGCIIAGSADTDAAKAAALLLCGGIAAAGGSVCYAPDCMPAALQTGAALHHCGMIVFCGGSRIRIFSRGLLPLTDAQLRTIRSGSANPQWIGTTECGRIITDRTLTGIYTAQLRRRLPVPLPFRAELRTASPLLGMMLRPVFSGGRGAELTLRISQDGCRASVYSAETGWLFYEKLLMMCAQQYLRQGMDTALPNWLPHTAEDMAAEYGRKVFRYAMHPDGSDTEARQLAAAQRFTLDGAVLCAEIMRLSAETGRSLREWAASLPECHTVRRILRTDAAADAMLRSVPALHASAETDGFRIKTEAGEALLHPSRCGDAVSMLVEARSTEAASELAGDIASLLLSDRQCRSPF
ncbi:MAG: hypothetical protein IKQ91_09795 [Oscillospiraceae bacterium]|nr:hypothetical protein [Oscillospiraceae bacterium]